MKYITRISLLTLLSALGGVPDALATIIIQNKTNVNLTAGTQRNKKFFDDPPTIDFPIAKNSSATIDTNQIIMQVPIKISVANPLDAKEYDTLYGIEIVPQANASYVITSEIKTSKSMYLKSNKQ